MKRKRILDIGFGRKTLYELYKSTEMSSRLLYGLAQLEDVYDIHHVSLERPNLKGTILNNFKVLGKYEIIFMTYLYLPPLFLLAVLRKIGFYKKRKLFAISHIALMSGRNCFERILNQLIYNSFDTIFFHSQKNLEESIDRGLIQNIHAEFLFWGDDLEYIDQHINCSQGNFFLSTGREQRDFPLLLSVFSKTTVPLELYTNKVNYDNNYGYLEEMQGKYPNVKIEFVEKSAKTTHMLAQRSAQCLCIVIPLLKQEIYYCLGLTSVVEAMAMGKPIISSRNPYSPIDIEKEQVGFVVDDEESWVKAINYMISHPEETKKMGEKARILAERKYNIRECARQLNRFFSE